MPVIIKWNPASNIFVLDSALAQIVDQIMDNVRAKKVEMNSAWVPVADMYETSHAMVIHSEMAGIEKNTLEIFFHNSYLLLRGQRPFSPDMQSAKIHRIERMYGFFQRIFWIPHPVDAQHISASYERGVLTIVLPKLKSPVPEQTKIPVTFK